MDMATALRNAIEAKKDFDKAIETYEHLRLSETTFEASKYALVAALRKARALGDAVEDLERAAGEVLS